MNRAFCAREDETAAATRTGTIAPEIASHARQCAACAEILFVTEFFQEEASLRDHEQLTMPDAGLIWKNAQSRATQESVRLALRPIRFMKIIAVIAFASSPLFRMLLPIGRHLFSSWSGALDFNIGSPLRLWPTMANESAILLASTATLILIGLSSWFMLRQE